MPQIALNSVVVMVDVAGVTGETVVLTHGSWADRLSWQLLVASLADHFRVVRYDRRGHGESSCPPGQGTRAQDEDDLAELLEVLDLAPAHVVGNSFGASIVLGLAARRPALFSSVIVHEPPLLSLVTG